MSKAFAADLKALLAEWPVWKVVSHQPDRPDPATGLFMCDLERTDDAGVRLRVSYGRSYPTGHLTVSKVGGSSQSTTLRNLQLSEAIDAALEQWEEEEDAAHGGGHRGDDGVHAEVAAGSDELDDDDGSSVPRDVTHRGAEGSHRRQELVASAVARLAASSSVYREDVAFLDDDAVSVRFVVPVASVSGAIACRALGLEANSALCVTCVMTQRLALGGEMQFRSLLSCDPSEASAAVPKSANDSLGPLNWYFASNFASVLRRRRILFLEDGSLAAAPMPTSSSSQPASWLATQFDHMVDAEKKPYLEALHEFALLLFQCSTSRCFLCDDPLPFAGVKMGVCVKPICNFSMDQYGLGVDVVGEMKKNPEVVELLIYFSCAAAASSQAGNRGTFTPMCYTNIGGSSVGGGGASSAAHRSGPTHFFEEGHFGDLNSKNYKLLHDTIQKIPPLRVMLEKSGGTNHGLRQYLAQEVGDLLVYPLLQWIISSNRSYIELLKPCDAVGNLGRLQFHLVTCDPQKEKVFQEHKRKAAAKGSRGSQFGWHGSSCYNWHAILREGLKNFSGTKMMSTGQLYGSGIYLANSLLTSQAYMGLPEHPWKNAELLAAPASPNSKGPGCTVISLCEFVDHPKFVQFHADGDIITVQHEELVVTRFLFVFPGGLRGGVNLAAKDLSPLTGFS